LGRKIAKKVNGTITKKYLWQGLTRLLAVYDGSGNLLMRFEYADSRMPIAMIKGGSTYYLTYDQVGSLRVVADASSNVVKRIHYDSFGNIIEDTDPSFEVPFGFAGGLHDRDTGFVRFGYRDYDPDTGRWTAKDPIFFVGGDTDLYGYCLSDPINFIDPTGEILSTIIGAVAGASSGFISGLERGNIAAGILGGIAGGVSGALVGTRNPLAGGATGGAISNFLSGDSVPCVKKATISGAIHGTIGALASTPIGILAKMGIGSLSATNLGKVAITMATTSVSTPVTIISSHVGSSL
jgi:RHS repeat-associated protein